MKEHLDNETMILINSSDVAKGYFIFGTTKQSDFNKLIKRIGGQSNLIEVKTTRNKNKVVYWSVKLPVSLYSKVSFGVKKKNGT